MDYQNMRLADLIEIGKERGIKYVRKYKKQELITLLQEQEPQQEQKVTPVPETVGIAEADTPMRSTEIPRPASVRYERKREDSETKKPLFDLQKSDANVDGILEVLPDGYGFIRSSKTYLASGHEDVYTPPQMIRRYQLKTGDNVVGFAVKRDNEKFEALIFIKSVNGQRPEFARTRRSFESLAPTYPDQRLRLENDPRNYAMRIIDLISPIGRGQRGLIVAPPKAGKTTLLKNIAKNILANQNDVKMIVLLIDERPEEVTDMIRSIEGADVVYSTFDMPPENHTKVAELVLERAKRLVEHGQDVVILLDSISRLARAYNMTVPASGRTLSGGLEVGALHLPKKFFGAARKIENGGSLTILATALVETGSRMDDVIFEEFKGTGNMELHLDRKLSERRIFPAIDIYKSGTRKEELLLSYDELNAVYHIRRAFGNANTADVTEYIISNLVTTKTNTEFVEKMNFELKNDKFTFKANHHNFY